MKYEDRIRNKQQIIRELNEKIKGDEKKHNELLDAIKSISDTPSIE